MSMMRATCPKCKHRIGWQGRAVDRPPCPKCGHEADIPPTFYENSGNPICDQFDECEGCEMTYVETRLLKRPL